jgi:hypothetical protein
MLIAGLLLLLASFCMFIWGIHIFTYKGDYTKFMSITGFYSFILCIPTFILAIILIVIADRKVDKT